MLPPMAIFFPLFTLLEDFGYLPRICLLYTSVPVLDATAIGVSMIRGDFKTAGSIMFLLGIGEILEEWTHKKSVDDLARSMALNVNSVWLCKDDDDVLVPASEVQEGDKMCIRDRTYSRKMSDR